jgi:hypothetical protein
MKILCSVMDVGRTYERQLLKTPRHMSSVQTQDAGFHCLHLMDGGSWEIFNGLAGTMYRPSASSTYSIIEGARIEFCHPHPPHDVKK